MQTSIARVLNQRKTQLDCDLSQSRDTDDVGPRKNSL
jgi:hypothetical protein